MAAYKATPSTAVIAEVTPGAPAVEITDLVKRFGTFTAVDHLSLTVLQCEIFGLLGPNGSGKTTTMNMISGLSAPTSGQVRVMGLDIRTNTKEVRQILGAVPQETALYDELTAWANLDFHADLFGVPTREKKARITQMLELVQLQDRKDSRVGTFSGGMKRRLALARALLHRPRLIYLDEPTLGVDVQSRRALWDHILQMREECKTIIVTTNYLEEAQVLCDRIAIIDHGQLLDIDSPDQLKQKYGGNVVELETAHPTGAIEALRALPGVKTVSQDGARLKLTTAAGSDVVPRIINLIARESDLKSITVREPNLDEVFLSLTGKALRD